MNPRQNAVSSQPVTSTTSAPERRRASARPAESAKTASASSSVRSTGNGANHTSSPWAAACSAATVMRAGSSPEILTVSQWSSVAISRISRATVSGSKTLRELSSPGRIPTS
ncbi:hypothetical protein [Nonomuraea fuscirosea]|uniref:hypothetical protein n=1 Tax=Nonomuraea fuscirosea TaxID=1291556 RepID=UPI001C628F0A|nr:hypothetical protein [Nonomuraea fuscirosea]